MIKLVIFDLDGTLVDTAKDIATAVEHTFAQHDMPELSYDKMLNLIGLGLIELIHHAFPDMKIDYHSVEKSFNKYHRAHLTDNSYIYEGAEDCLIALKERGIRLTVLTNKHTILAHELLKALEIHRYFEIVAGPDTFGAYKPSPRGMLRILELQNIKPEETIMIGDGDTDIKAANKAGIWSVAVTYGFKSKDELKTYKPDFFIDTPGELLDVIDDINDKMPS